MGRDPDDFDQSSNRARPRPSVCPSTPFLFAQRIRLGAKAHRFCRRPWRATIDWLPRQTNPWWRANQNPVEGPLRTADSDRRQGVGDHATAASRFAWAVLRMAHRPGCSPVVHSISGYTASGLGGVLRGCRPRRYVSPRYRLLRRNKRVSRCVAGLTNPWGECEVVSFDGRDVL